MPAFSKLGLVGIILTAAVSSAHAATYAVDRTDDDPTATACTETPNDCSLRGAIVKANTETGTEEIIVPAGLYELTIPPSEADADAGYAMNGGDLDIGSNVTIRGEGARTTQIIQKMSDRVVQIIQNVGQVVLEDLTIAGGKSSWETWPHGGGLLVGAMSNVVLRRCHVTDNSATGYGGGIHNFGTLTMEQSAVSANRAVRGGAGIYTNVPHGGLDGYRGSLTLLNSTVSGNLSVGGVAGLYLVNYGPVTLSGVTVAANKVCDQVTTEPYCQTLKASPPAAGLGTAGSGTHPITIKNSIFADNGAFEQKDCGGKVTSGKHNLIEANACVGLDVTDITSADPKLSVLADNGGSTDTHALLLDSPALGVGEGCETLDQRGVVRGILCDLGSFGRGCGDRIVDTGEGCDDGNTSDGDGCSATCQTESLSGGEDGGGDTGSHDAINDTGTVTDNESGETTGGTVPAAPSGPTESSPSPSSGASGGCSLIRS